MPNGEQSPRIHAVVEAGKIFVRAILDNVPDCPNREIALKSVREASVLAYFGIRCDGLEYAGEESTAASGHQIRLVKS